MICYSREMPNQKRKILKQSTFGIMHCFFRAIKAGDITREDGFSFCLLETVNIKSFITISFSVLRYLWVWGFASIYRIAIFCYSKTTQTLWVKLCRTSRSGITVFVRFLSPYTAALTSQVLKKK